MTHAVLSVRAPSHAYEVVVGPGVLGQLGARTAALFPRRSGRVLLAHDAGLPEALVRAAADSLSRERFTVSAVALTATESAKSLGGATRLLESLARARHERFDPVVALGGGVVGDVAGFAAAIHRRGVPVVQCPTTLLSMVDAAVGGKTGVNLLADGVLHKNLVGAFHSPSLVLADTRSLTTLPDRALRSGLAECVKHGLLGADFGDPGLFDWIGSRRDAIVGRDDAALAELIARNVAIKARVVEGDPFELDSGSGGRALLNLGHTFAHAIETLPGLSPTGVPGDAPLQHGEAVAVGLVAASWASVALGMLPASEALRTRELLRAIGLPTRLAGLPGHDSLMDRMAGDKKTVGGKLRIVVPVPGCRARVIEDPPRTALEAGWSGVDSSAASA